MVSASESPIDLDRFELVLLKRPASVPAMSEAEIDELQDRHIAYLVQQADAGAIRVAGPFDQQVDETLRGMALYQTGSLERTRSLASSDPSVIAGRLEIDVMYFYCPKGEI